MEKSEDEDSASAESPKATERSPFKPPEGLTYEEQMMWFDAQIAEVEVWRGVLTEKYFEETKAKVLKQLEAAKNKTDLEHKLPEKTTENPRRNAKP
jgi:hypothetical protein